MKTQTTDSQNASSAMQEQTTLADFIRQHGITMSTTRVNSNPINNDWGADARHFLCVLEMDHQTFSTPFSQGSAHRADPTAEDVLNCMSSDCASVENDSFEAWCSELGYDEDSRKAEKIYNACVDAAVRLKDFLGNEAYEQLLWNTERL